MRPMQMEYYGDMEEREGSSVAMDVDDVDPLDFFGDCALTADNKLADSDFFNSFQDDFDDQDIN